MIDFTDIQLFKSKISILTIPRNNFWLFKSGILEIIYRLIENYENRSNSRYSDLSDSLVDENNISDDSLMYDNNNNNNNNNSGSNKENSYNLSNSTQNILNDYNDNNNSIIEDNEIDDDGMFFHLAFTTEEVTIMCSKKLIKKYLLKPLNYDKESTLINQEFFIIQVSSDGSNIGKKILELTQPLSLNNISLFFISNYFSDLVLIPIKDKSKTLEILKDMNINNSFEDLNNNNTSSYFEDLEDKTFKLFKDNNIKPILKDDVKLILTGARTGDFVEVLKQTIEALSRLNTENFKGNKNNNKIFPEYFAITRTPTEEIGLLLPYDNEELNKLKYCKSNMIGSLQDYYYPILINLKDLPIDLKGIVAGIASKLLRLHIGEMSYLSLGKSGIVLIPDMFKDMVEEIL